MPKQAIDYSNTVIYTIRHLENEELLYVGHTTNLTHRKHGHKSKSNPSNKSDPTKLYKMIRENGGWEAFEMKPIKQFSCSGPIEACIEEEKCRVELRASMNTNYASQTEESRTKVKAKHKKYLEDNKDYFKQNKAEYYIAQKEKFLQKAKENYIKNKERFVCSCGASVSLHNKLRHETSKMHQAYIDSIV